MIKSTLLFIVIIIMCQISACQTKKNNMKSKFEWFHTLSAPKDYPIEVVQGRLNSSTGTLASFSPIWGIINEGWGIDGGMAPSGPDEKEVPESLDITWLSFREDKFYTGQFDLPKEKMTELFRQSIYGNVSDVPYNFFIIGLAPGGVVVIWLMGDQVQTEVARFQAKEVSKDQLNITGDEKIMLKPDYTDRKLANREINRDAIPFGLWDTYRVKYNWKIKVVLPEKFRLGKKWMTMFNGEKEHYFVQQPDYDIYKLRAIPSYISFSWYDEKGDKFGVDLNFNEEEIFKAYKAIYRDDHKQEIDLTFTLDDKRKNFIVKLKSKEVEYELRKSTGGIYTMKKDK